MTVRAYPEYRDSQSPLLGSVPVHWSARQIKHIARLAYGESLPADGRNEDGLIKVFGSNGAIGTHGIANTSKPVIIVGRKGSYGALNWSDDPVFAIDTTYYIDNTCSKCNMRWLFWALQAANLSAFSQDTGVPGLARELVHSLAFVSPSEAEQSAIAAFLDRETGKIDALVAEQERLIALLKEKRQAVISHAVTKGLNPNAPMKDSGVPWLGEVPSHWEVRRLGWVCGFRSGKAHEPFFEEDGEYLCVTARFISTNGRSARRCSKNLSPARQGDILMVMSDLPKGRALARTYKTKSSDILAVNQRVCIVTPHQGSAAFFNYQLDRNPGLLRHDDGINQTHLSNSEFTSLFLVVPSCEEQDHIATDLDSITEQLDVMSEQAARAITLLRERRAALISAAVTGKIDVRDTVAQPSSQAA